MSLIENILSYFSVNSSHCFTIFRYFINVNPVNFLLNPRIRPQVFNRLNVLIIKHVIRTDLPMSHPLIILITSYLISLFKIINNTLLNRRLVLNRIGVLHLKFEIYLTLKCPAILLIHLCFPLLLLQEFHWKWFVVKLIHVVFKRRFLTGNS